MIDEPKYLDAMFRGIHPIKLDSKYRMRIPAKYYTQLEEICNGKMVITIEPNDRCLLLYPFPIWEELEIKINNLPNFGSASRRLQRLLIGHALEVNIDLSGRILLSRSHRDYARIDKILNLIGQGQKFEIWSEAIWQENVKKWTEENSREESTSSSIDNLSI